MSGRDLEPTGRRVGVGAGLFFASSAILMLEVSLTRILSVVMWYHFAFFAISVALFGLAAAGMLVYLLPGAFPSGRAIERSFAAALLLAVATPLSFWILAENPSYTYLTSGAGSKGALGAVGLLQVALLYLIGVLPFFLGGLVGAVVFRHFGARAGRLYFYDLMGAGLGCLATVPVLDLVGGPGAMAAVSVLAAVAGLLFALAGRHAGRAVIAGALALAATFVLATNSSTHLLHLHYSRGRALAGVQVERWNSFSRVTVRDFGTPDTLLLEIDAASNTLISRWDGRLASLSSLGDNLIAVQYTLVEQPVVFVIGSGGGIDLLTAISQGARRVTAVEVNPIIVDLMRRRYAAFSGGIYNRPDVRVVTDEARSYIRRAHEKYDVIQAGYVDTYAATAAGAFALTENTLYTVEAYEDYLAHLTPDGIVAIQRYYEQPPQQSIRLVALALDALARRGDPHPASHVIVVRKDDRASVLVKNSPFTEVDVARVEAHCRRAGLELVAAPGRPGKGLYGELLGPGDFRRTIASYALDISPVHDDRPFFFYVVKPSQFWKGLLSMTGERMNSRAVFLLVALLFVASVLCAILLAAPAWAGRAGLAPGTIPAVGYFGFLGLGFILVEIGVLQRAMLFLGHPALALSVVLTTLLLSAGLGSWSIRGIEVERTGPALARRLWAIVAAVLLAAFVWPPVFRALIGFERSGRIAVAVAALAPVGFLMGTAMPLGLRRLAEARAPLIPWAWSVNGGTSVLGSVLAMVVAINNSFTATLLAGAACYLAALFLAPSTAAPGREVPGAEAS